MRKYLVAGIAALGLAGSVAHAGAFRAADVAAGAKWVLHADLDQFKQTAVGRLFVDGLAADEHARKLDALEAVIGMDVRRQLGGWTMYGLSGDKQDSVILASGNFDPAQFIKLVRANDHYRTFAHAGTTVHAGRNEKSEPFFIAFPATGRAVVASSEPGIKDALDVLGGGKPSLAQQNAAGLPLEGSSGRAFFAAAAALNEIKNADPQARTLRIARTGALTLGEEAGSVLASIDLAAGSAEDAVHLQDAVRGLIALALLDDKHDAGTRQAIRDTKVEVEGSRLHIALRVPAGLVIDGMRKDWEKRARAKAAAAEKT
jgi:hypothetical protein